MNIKHTPYVGGLKLTMQIFCRFFLQQFEGLLTNLLIFLDDTDCTEELNRNLDKYSHENAVDLHIVKNMFKCLLITLQGGMLVVAIMTFKGQNS